MAQRERDSVNFWPGYGLPKLGLISQMPVSAKKWQFVGPGLGEGARGSARLASSCQSRQVELTKCANREAIGPTVWEIRASAKGGLLTNGGQIYRLFARVISTKFGQNATSWWVKISAKFQRDSCSARVFLTLGVKVGVKVKVKV